MDHFPFLFKAGGLLTIYFELFFILLVVRKGGRFLAFIGGLFMHNAIGYLMYISFSHYLQAFYFFLIDFKSQLSPKTEKLSTYKWPSFTNYRVLIPTIILLANISCGIIRVNSYPFSIYPIYAELIPNTVSYFHYETDNGTILDIRNIAGDQRPNFETYSRIEYHLIRESTYGKEIPCDESLAIWNRWKAMYPELNSYNELNIYIVEKTLDPKDSAEFVSKTFLRRINLTNETCID